MPRKKNLILVVKTWLKKPGNTKVKLANSLGYNSSSTVGNWLRRKSIPEYMRDSIEECCK
jgi:hypothetical protein